MRLLLVEDDDHVAAALSAVLAKHGFAVVHARNGEEALRALLPDDRAPKEPFGVVLLDLGLPDQDGYEVCGKIRKRTAIPVIMVTARADVRSRIHGLNLGADDYVVKPYDTGELLARIHAVSRRTTTGEDSGAIRRPPCGWGASTSSCPPAGSASTASASSSPARSSTCSRCSPSGPGWSSGASRSSARCGAPVGRARGAPWKCMSPPCAPSCGCRP